MLSRSYIEKILDYVISFGADYAEVFFEDALRTRFKLMDGRLTSCACGRESGIGIRMIRGLKSEYLYSEDVKEEQVFRLLKEHFSRQCVCGGSREPLQRITPHRIRIFGQGAEAMPCKLRSGSVCSEADAGEMPLRKKIVLLREAVEAAKGSEDCIVQGSACYTEEDQWVQIANTEGIFAEDRRARVRARITMTAGDERSEGQQTGFVGPGAMSGPEFLETGVIEESAKRAAHSAKTMLGARTCPVGRMPVIIANGFGGLFFHEACGHSLEGSSVASGCSEFSGKLGEKIASEKVTLIDDGRIEGEWGSLGIDDEGVLTQKNVLIEKGVLKSYLLDRLSAKRMGLSPTGSGRRENYRFAPVSRMTNTYIAPGNDRFEDMIGSVEKGLYVKDINAGSVDPATGEFNFNTGETYLIEKGKITSPLKSATLIGTGRDILPKVDMVSDNFALDQGYCYAGSGQIPIGVGQPAVRITEMTVGGKEV